MDDPLWTDAHAPGIDDLPQADARERLERAVDEPMNVLIHGPPGCGKTAAARALAREAHEDPENDLVTINVADFFARRKKEIREDPRFSEFLKGEIPWVKQLGSGEKSNLSKRYKSDWSKAEMTSHVLQELAGYPPSTGEYKTLLLDNAESVREDFQQSLRRTMERHHRSTQFVIATRQPTRLIPPIRSRCYTVPMRAPTVEEVGDVLRGILEAEEVPHDDDGVEYVAADADGNLRSAILAAQTVYSREEEVTMETAYEVLGDVGVESDVEAMLAEAESGDFSAARSTLDDLLYDEGLSGEEVLETILSVAPRRYGDDELARLHELAGEVDFDLQEGTSDRVHIGHLLAELAG